MNTLFLVIYFLFSTCLNKQTDFQLIQIPDSLQTPKERCSYLLTHYWSNLSVGQGTINYDFEQPFVDFLSVLPHGTSQDKEQAVHLFFEKLNQNPSLFQYFSELAHKYLYSFDSPMRNDELYILFLQAILDSPFCSETEYVRLNFRLNLALKNRVGHQASDFKFKTLDDETSSLYQQNSSYTLLLFFDPDCIDCVKIIDELKQNRVIQQAIDNKRLTLLAIYTETNIQVWEDFSQTLPSSWKTGITIDPILETNLYDLKRMPTLYLLDKHKKVVLKETLPQFIKDQLSI